MNCAAGYPQHQASAPEDGRALFAPEVVQIECDNAASPYGIVTTTYENVAKDVLDVEGIMIASEIEN